MVRNLNKPAKAFMLEEFYFDEENILEEVEDDFNDTIKERGKNYYYAGKILKCFKNNHQYYAKVKGTGTKPYIVKIKFKEDHYVYDCTCPCDFPCKHEYAVIMAIAHHEYSEIKLKPEIKEEKDSLYNVLSQIPAQDIKNYLLSPKGIDSVWFDKEAFEEQFRSFYPTQSYEYYYNNLYNDLMIDQDYDKRMHSYIHLIRQYIANQAFEEGFKILKSIIEAYHDTNHLNYDENLINQFSNLGLLFRIIYNNSDIILKKEIERWIMDIEIKDYFNNLYLKDMILMVNFDK